MKQIFPKNVEDLTKDCWPIVNIINGAEHSWYILLTRYTMTALNVYVFGDIVQKKIEKPIYLEDIDYDVWFFSDGKITFTIFGHSSPPPPEDGDYLNSYQICSDQFSFSEDFKAAFEALVELLEPYLDRNDPEIQRRTERLSQLGC